MEKIYYTYVYCDPRRPGIWKTDLFTFFYEPFYIGEGKNKRIYAHMHTKNLSGRQNWLKINKIKKILREGYNPIIFKVAENLSGDEGVDIETVLIKQIGTITEIKTVQRGPLTNMKLHDGKKQLYSEELRKRMSDIQRNRAPEIHAKIAEKNRGQKRSEETRKRISTAFNRTPEAVANRSNANRRPCSEETKMKISNANSGRINSPAHNASISAAQKGKTVSQETRAKLSKSKLKQFTILTEAGLIILTENLGEWCIANDVHYSSIKNTKRYDKFHKGYKFVTSIIIP